MNSLTPTHAGRLSPGARQVGDLPAEQADPRVAASQPRPGTPLSSAPPRLSSVELPLGPRQRAALPSRQDQEPLNVEGGKSSPTAAGKMGTSGEFEPSSVREARVETEKWNQARLHRKNNFIARKGAYPAKLPKAEIETLQAAVEHLHTSGNLEEPIRSAVKNYSLNEKQTSLLKQMTCSPHPHSLRERVSTTKSMSYHCNNSFAAGNAWQEAAACTTGAGINAIIEKWEVAGRASQQQLRLDAALNVLNLSWGGKSPEEIRRKPVDLSELAKEFGLDRRTLSDLIRFSLNEQNGGWEACTLCSNQAEIDAYLKASGITVEKAAQLPPEPGETDLQTKAGIDRLVKFHRKRATLIGGEAEFHRACERSGGGPIDVADLIKKFADPARLEWTLFTRIIESNNVEKIEKEKRAEVYSQLAKDWKISDQEKLHLASVVGLKEQDVTTEAQSSPPSEPPVPPVSNIQKVSAYLASWL